jgi:hypothetical protein
MLAQSGGQFLPGNNGKPKTAEVLCFMPTIPMRG